MIKSVKLLSPNPRGWLLRNHVTCRPSANLTDKSGTPHPHPAAALPHLTPFFPFLPPDLSYMLLLPFQYKLASETVSLVIPTCRKQEILLLSYSPSCVSSVQWPTGVRVPARGCYGHSVGYWGFNRKRDKVQLLTVEYCNL